MQKKNKILRAAGLLCAAALCLAGAKAGWTGGSTEIVAQAAADIRTTAAITSCTIASDKNTIQIKADSNGDMNATDGKFYLFELKPYESGIGSRRDFLATAGGGNSMSFQTTLDYGQESDKLYSSFVVAVYDGTQFITVSEPHYITNPEIMAKNQAEFKDPSTKKGLNIELSMLSDAFDLGVKHVGTNIAFHQILGEGIDFTYDGKTYHFNKGVIEDYDRTISALSGKGMTVTAIILNGWNDATPDLIYPGTKKSSNAFYYLFNAATEKGFDQTRAIIAFLADRYDGSNPNYGKISNWIVGNEINNQQWNYTGEWDLTSYVKAYQKAFRVFYTAIKSTSANDRVYFSLDYNWNNPQEKDGKLKYGGKEIVDSFNSIANDWGQIDWGLAYHPYPCPMTEPEFWDDDKTGLITNDFNSPVINFKNLGILTQYFEQTALRARSGNVRHIILTEQGFTGVDAARGDIQNIQAAAFAYSYYLVDSNPYIDAYILSRQIDAPSERKLNLGFGLWECDMNQPNQIVPTKRRKIWQVFRDIDKKKDTLEASEFAKSIIGINKWSDVVPNFRWRALEK
ncbi:DUF5722 domain-containing protein [Clostridium sp. AM58-1XD]|uniref:DUF5722 domain-containing protein n=1 Tax=Clostridium sp. AM58-1XD TaxID=2292307 RepID=UPI000E4BE326|nr:DUF5722 domain-containing protein [Clostridium sp. AM58-1XD]RGZ00949.1 Tat pathway signal protein [Clostridium sp. AM58-1XD]